MQMGRYSLNEAQLDDIAKTVSVQHFTCGDADPVTLFNDIVASTDWDDFRTALDESHAMVWEPFEDYEWKDVISMMMALYTTVNDSIKEHLVGGDYADAP
jgi:hypothetical protein